MRRTSGQDAEQPTSKSSLRQGEVNCSYRHHSWTRWTFQSNVRGLRGISVRLVQTGDLRPVLQTASVIRGDRHAGKRDLSLPACRSWKLKWIEDGGPQAKTGTTSIQVNVIDSNDNKPVFVGGPTFEVAVVENTPPGTVVIRLEAHDADEGLNGQVSYSFAPSTLNSPAVQVFAIRNDTGELTVKVRLFVYRGQHSWPLSVAWGSSFQNLGA